MTRDIRRTTDEASTPKPVTRRTVLASTAAGIAAAGGATAAVTAQSGDETGDSGEETAGSDGELSAVSLDLSNLPELGEDAYYEGWAIFGEEKVSTGVFSRGEEYVFEVDRDLADADRIVVTIEPDDEAGGPPSGIVALAGALSDGEADLSFPLSFAESSGSFLLNTPTAPEVKGVSGVWFLEIEDEAHVASLDVPDLSEEAGWTYEGWIVHEGVPISTGRFDDPTTADVAAPYSGEMDGPDFPGEDLVTNEPEDDLIFPTDLTDGDSSVVVSVEPDLDGDDPTGDGPFQVKPLAGEIPADAEVGASNDLPHNEGTLPSGTATLYRDADTARRPPAEDNAVAFDLSNLPELGDDAYYEGWAIFGKEKVSTGVFSRGQEYVFGVDRDLAEADRLAITIEPDDEPGGDPSGIVALSGALEGGEADLSFPTTFTDPSGSFLLNTPTAPDAAGESGVWFLESNPDGEGHVASLSLPPLASGWTYEGWAVIDGRPVTTGRFDDPTASDDAAPYSGEADGPGFPGEDFVQNAPEGLEFPTDLTDGDSSVVVSLEPDLDGEDPTGPDPFQIKPLVGDVPDDAEAATSYDLSHNEGTLPSGSATLHDDVEAAVRADQQNAVAFDLSTLPELGDGAVYEGWATFGEEEMSTGTFSAGQEYVFGVDRDLADADELAITIEPEGGAEDGPSGVIVLAGAVEDGGAELSFPVAFDQAAGSYLLNTPTAPDVAMESGLWFLEPDPAGDGHVASLDLPDLANVQGWTYEGWAVIDGTPVTTGRFDDPSMADASAPYSGDGEAPPFPGEDFVRDAPDGLTFPTDLADGDSSAVITVEPDLDGEDPTGDAPFPIEPLVADIPADAAGATSYDLEGDADAAPAGSATLYDDVETAHEARERMELTLELSDLPELEQGVYEGWAIFGEEKVSTGTFGATDEHAMALDRDLTGADAVAITIESEGGADGGPSGVVILHGELEGSVTSLDCPVAFEGAGGSFLLNTPTSPPTMAQSGVWFLRPSGNDGHEASLTLPELPDGWTYEGWIVTEGVPISTGRFDDPAAPDDAAPYSGTEPAPEFPGEDLITNEPTDDLVFPTDLTDGDSSVVVSVEPDVDGEDPTGDGPFAFKPLVGEIPADAQGGGIHGLDPNPTTLPSGTAIVGEDSTVTVDGQVVRDVDADGDYMDVTGDGTVGQGDIGEFFAKQHRDAWKRPELFDFSGNGDVTHGDVVELADYVAIN